MTYASPTFENPCPDLTDDEYQELKQKIERQGFLPAYPVIKSAGPARPGEIVDGFHRVKICDELGIEPVVVEVPFETEAEFLLEQIDANLTRRQLNKDQRIRLVLKRKSLVAEVEASARARQGTRTDLAGANIPPNLAEGGTRAERETRAVLGKMAGVGGETFRKHAAVVESGDEYLNTELSAGRMSTDMAYRKLTEQRDADLAHQAEAEAELEEHFPPTPDTGRAAARERAVGEAVRMAIALDQHLNQHAIIPDEVYDYQSRPHTFKSTVSRLSDWLLSLKDVLK